MSVCFKCGVPHFKGCKHHSAEGPAPLIEETPTDKRSLRTDQGLHYKAKRGNLNSLFGSKGNPNLTEFKKMIKK